MPVENAMNASPDRARDPPVLAVHSGVTVIFEEGTVFTGLRQQVGERFTLARADIPEEFGSPEMGPIATGPGDLPVRGPQRRQRPAPAAAMELRTIRLGGRPRSGSVPGVIEVNALGAS